jgi:hypothetical protein
MPLQRLPKGEESPQLKQDHSFIAESIAYKIAAF